MTQFKDFMQVVGSGNRRRFQICSDGPKAVIEFHFAVESDEAMRKYDHNGHFPFFAHGVECHERVPIEESSPWGKECVLLGNQPCKHDGTSLWACEVVMPAFLAGGTEAVYPLLHSFYRSRFERGEEE